MGQFVVPNAASFYQQLVGSKGGNLNVVLTVNDPSPAHGTMKDVTRQIKGTISIDNSTNLSISVPGGFHPGARQGVNAQAATITSIAVLANPAAQAKYMAQQKPNAPLVSPGNMVQPQHVLVPDLRTMASTHP
jgi:hypothetical protein